MIKKKHVKELRKVNDVVLGGALVGGMVPLLSRQPGSMTGAARTAGSVYVGAKMSDVAFGAIDNIYKAKPLKYKKIKKSKKYKKVKWI